MGVTPITNTAAKPANNLPAIKSFFSGESVKGKFTELLGKKAPGFITNVMQVVTNNSLLVKADASSIYQAAAMAAILDLSVNQSLGHAWIVPYSGKAQFQIGYRGLIQLAHRSGQYRKINAIPVYANQFAGWNALTEEFNADFNITGTGAPIGYVSRFELVNGFEKITYWTREAVENHARRYSKSFNSGPWQTHFDQMALKTVLKDSLSHWGILSIEMEKAIEADQSIVEDAEQGSYSYPDNEDASSESIQETPEQIAEFNRCVEFLNQCVTAVDVRNLGTKVPTERFSERQAASWNQLFDEKHKSLS